MADIISTLKALDDKALMAKIGLETQLTKFKEDLERADKLTGKPREKVVDALDRIFTPQSYEMSDVHYAVNRAEKMDKKMDDPSDVVGCCCGMPGDYD